MIPLVSTSIIFRKENNPITVLYKDLLGDLGLFYGKDVNQSLQADTFGVVIQINELVESGRSF